MVQVPKYTPSVAERPLMQQSLTTQASPSDFGAQIGSGMQQIAQGAQQASNQMYDLRQLEASAEAKSAHTAFSNWERDARINFVSLKGRGAVEASPDYKRMLEEQKRKFSEGLRPDAAVIYADAAASRIQSSLETAAVHTNREKITWINDENDARQTLLADDALAAYDNPAKVDQYIQAGRAEIKQKAELNGWGPDELEQAERVYASSILNNVVLRQAQDDPIAAAEYVLANPDRFTASDGYALMVSLQPMVQAAAARDAVAIAGNAPSIPPGSTTADVVRQFEGFREGAYNDPRTSDTGQQVGANIYRAGYGSDTITRADGTVERVTKNTIVTRADAERDLERRLGEFQQGIVAKVGPQAWQGLDGATQAALTSVAYNYGSLPNSVAAAVASGDRVAIASAVKALSGHNGGINANRRQQEASLILNGTGSGVQFSERVENLLGAMPANAAVQVREAAAAEMSRQQTAMRVAANAETAALKDSFALGILTGAVTSEQTILEASLPDGDKAILVRSLRTEMGANADARALIAGLQNGTSRTLNPFSTDDQTVADKAHETMLKSVAPEQQANLTRAFITQTGMIPKSTIADVQMGLASRDAATAQAALQYAAMLERTAPTALSTITNGAAVRDAADLYDAYVNGMGYTPEVAAQRYLESTDPDKVRDRDALLKSKSVADAIKNVSASDVSAIFPSLPLLGLQVGDSEATKAAMVGEYKRIFEQSIVDASGDMTVAKELSSVRFQRRYGSSDMSLAGGGVITRLPPEKTYQPMPDGSHDYVSTQLRDALSAEGVEFDDVRLVSYDETDADFATGAAARYQVYYQSNGQWQLYNLPFSADYAVGLDTYNAEQQRLMDEREAQRQANMAAELEQWPDGRGGPERFPNGELRYGLAGVDSPMGRAIAAQKEWSAEQRAQWEAEIAAEAPDLMPGSPEWDQMLNERFGATNAIP